ncbi:hypothetical protein GJ496_007445 [Pomphorhynchus laevis]|nr:hypothetical protein GJ496_007445 [Pomphorhynchus laevis]
MIDQCQFMPKYDEKLSSPETDDEYTRYNIYSPVMISNLYSHISNARSTPQHDQNSSVSMSPIENFNNKLHREVNNEQHQYGTEVYPNLQKYNLPVTNINSPVTAVNPPNKIIQHNLDEIHKRQCNFKNCDGQCQGDSHSCREIFFKSMIKILIIISRSFIPNRVNYTRAVYQVREIFHKITAPDKYLLYNLMSFIKFDKVQKNMILILLYLLSLSPVNANLKASVNLSDIPVLDLDGYFVLPAKQTDEEAFLLRETWITIDDEAGDNFSNIVYIRSNGHFTIPNYMLAPCGSSHVIRFNNPTYKIPAVRLDISTKGGRIRCRYFNAIAPSNDVSSVIADCPPLVMDFALFKPFNYFEQKQAYNVKDVIFSPMFLMMVIPIIILIILPKLSLDENNDQNQN